MLELKKVTPDELDEEKKVDGKYDPTKSTPSRYRPPCHPEVGNCNPSAECEPGRPN